MVITSFLLEYFQQKFKNVGNIKIKFYSILFFLEKIREATSVWRALTLVNWARNSENLKKKNYLRIANLTDNFSRDNPCALKNVLLRKRRQQSRLQTGRYVGIVKWYNNILFSSLTTHYLGTLSKLYYVKVIWKNRW